MQAQNGRFAVDCPTDLPPMLVNAERLGAVWSACDGEPRARVTDANLTVTSGRLRARIALLDPSTYPRTSPTAKTAHSAASLAPALRRLLPFVAEDASRPWATSICLTARYAYATNNTIVARVPIDAGIETPINVPGSSVEAILDCGELLEVGADDLSMTFYLSGDIWVKCQLVVGEWPTATVDGLVDSLPTDGWVTPHPQLKAMLDVAAKLSDGRHPAVVFRDGQSLCLEDDAVVADDLSPLPEAGKVNARMAALVVGQASEVQWHTPRQDVHAFRAGDLVGVFGGMR